MTPGPGGPGTVRPWPTALDPSTPCVHPAFELLKAPKTLSAVELNDRPLAATDYAWDGHVLWLNATLRGETTVRLTFAE